MPLTILAVVPEVATARTCLDGAHAAARVEDDAQIEVLHIEVDPQRLIAAPEEIAIQRLREHDEGTSHQRAHAVRAAFDSWRLTLSPAEAERVKWRDLAGAEEATLVQEAKHADLLVIARPHNIDGGDAMHAAVFEAHRPLLVPTPWTAGEAAILGGHIAVAWKPTPQARLAVEGAGPWLRKARLVTLLMVAKDLDHSGVNEARHLANAVGFSADEVLIRPDGRRTADQLLGTVASIDVDALVLGAYRLSEFVGWALPSTTRHVMAHTTIPLFLAH